jgi:hypothetical protein
VLWTNLWRGACPGEVAPGGGTFDHVALAARDRVAVAERLARLGAPFELRALPDGSALQMFVRDPDGARLELLFRSKEDC